MSAGREVVGLVVALSEVCDCNVFVPADVVGVDVAAEPMEAVEGKVV